MTLRRDRRRGQKRSPDPSKFQPICHNCGQPGRHFVPPSFGDRGFFICDKADQS